MKPDGTISEKKYLSIGEVAEKFSVSVEVLRKWEKNFPRELKPMRTKGGSRLYDRKQQEKVAMIIHLLRNEGLSIEGAKKKLSSRQSDEETRQEVISRLTSVRNELMDVVKELESLETKATSIPAEGVIWFNEK